MNTFLNPQQVNIIAPLGVLTLGALITLLFEVFLSFQWRREVVSATTVVIALILYLVNGDAFQSQEVFFSGQLYADPFSRFFAIVILGGALGALILGVNTLRNSGIESSGEYHALLLFCLVGAIVFVSAAHSIVLFVGLEIMSLALYALCASAPMKPRSSESALKYFLLGSFSSAFLLYGIALLYGLTGTMELAEISSKLSGVDSYLPMIALVFVSIGLLFKIGAVPFHSWLPDVYQGAPMPVTVFMASAIKAAACAVLLRVFAGLMPDYAALWSGIIACAAILTMIVGNLLALQQRSMKRMLAYSSIAHVGYILIGIIALTKNGGSPAILFYIVIYSLMTFGSFGIVHIISDNLSSQRNSDDISRFQGLGSSNPMLAALMSLFLFSLAGLPPGVAGLVGKIFLFSSAVRADFVILSVFGVLSSAVSCYYYLRVVVAMYFMDEVVGGNSVGALAVSLPLRIALILCAALVILLGLFPSMLYDYSLIASQRLL